MNTKIIQHKFVQLLLKKLLSLFILTITFNAHSQTDDRITLQNYPNPFNSSTTIYYTIPATSAVELIIFNLLGRKIEIIEASDKAPGSYGLEWKAKNLPEGIYLLQLRTDDQIITKKIVLDK